MFAKFSLKKNHLFNQRSLLFIFINENDRGKHKKVKSPLSKKKHKKVGIRYLNILLQFFLTIALNNS